MVVRVVTRAKASALTRATNSGVDVAADDANEGSSIKSRHVRARRGSFDSITSLVAMRLAVARWAAGAVRSASPPGATASASGSLAAAAWRAHAGGGGAAASSARRALSDLSPSAASNLAPTPRERLFAALPGLGLACGVAQAGFYLADEITARSGVPVAGVPVAILLGACANNAPVPLPSAFRPGIALASSLVLRVGIVCVGAKLSAMDVVTDGASSLPAALASVGAGVLIIPRLARLAGLDPRLGALLAAGTSVCGVTAVSALAPAVAATQAEVTVAVANVVIWGSLGMLALPHLAHELLGRRSSEAAGTWIGLGVHDTAQVFAAGLSYKQSFDDDVAFRVAAVTKLARNATLFAAIPFLAAQVKRTHPAGAAIVKASSSGSSSAKLFGTAIPPFLLAFLFASAVRSAGDAVFATRWWAETDAPARWNALAKFVGDEVGARHCLGTATAAVGLGTSASVARAAGAAPFLVGGAGAAVVGGVGFACAALMASASGGRDGDEIGGLIGSLAVRRKNPPNITPYVPPNERGDVRRRKE
jgi:uncharacterized integral membrane protein (TIGR00698 family)